MCSIVRLTVSPELTQILHNTPEDLRLIQIVFTKEQMELGNSHQCGASYESDWDAQVVPECKENEPCLILYRLDTCTGCSYEYVLIAWIPDSTRNKMILSIAQSHLIKLFGRERIVKIMSSASSLDEVTLSAYRSSVNFKSEDAMSREELENMEIKMQERNYAATSAKLVSSIELSMDENLVPELQKVMGKDGNFLSFGMNAKKEQITFISRKNVPIEKICSVDQPSGFLLYRYDHVHEEAEQTAYIFVYIIPGYSSSIKERMMYASSKAGFIKFLNSLELGKLFTSELETVSELTEDYVQRLLYPEKDSGFKKYSRPTGPKNRGPRRL